MDVGERPGTRGGWPNNVPTGSMNFSKNEDLYTTVTAVKGNQITTADVLPASITNAQVLHDDTAAFQAAIDAASAAGGGTVQIGAGTYLIQRPVFVVTASGANPVFTNTVKADAWYSIYSYLNIRPIRRGTFTCRVPVTVRSSTHLPTMEAWRRCSQRAFASVQMTTRA